MPTMDRRIKGCRNVHCRYNKERKHLPLDYNYCPICGEKVGLVCRECFAEIEDLGKTHFRCGACCRESSEEGSAGGRESSEEGDCGALKEKIRGRDAQRAAALRASLFI